MGIRASVWCNCYAKNKTTPCPYPEHFRLDMTEGPSLDLDIANHATEHQQFQKWLDTCCEHAGMVYLSVYITSWQGYRAFTNVLEALGQDRFQTLLKATPYGDEDGLTHPAISARILEELAYFNQLEIVTTKAVLVDSERQRDISMGSAIDGGALTIDHNTGLDVGFDDDGFFIRDRWELNRYVFRAKQVEQRLIHPESSIVEYRDLDSDRVFQCSTPFGKAIIGEDGLPRMYLWRFHVEQRTFGPGAYAHITEPLIRLFNASVEMDNPVKWG